MRLRLAATWVLTVTSAVLVTSRPAHADLTDDVLACKTLDLHSCEALQLAAASRKDEVAGLVQRLQAAETTAVDKAKLATALSLLDIRDQAGVLDTVGKSLQGQAELADVRVAQARLGDVRAVPDLIALLQGQDLRSRLLAAGGLGLLRAKEAAPALLAAVQDAKATRVQAEAARALGAIGDLSAEDPLINLAANPGAYLPSRAAALQSLAKLGSKKAVVIAAMLGDHPTTEIARSALQVLDAQWVRYALPAVVAAAEVPGRRGDVARLVSQHALTDVAPRLLQAVRDGDIDAAERTFVLDAVARTKPQGAGQVLLTRLQKGDKDERIEILRALPKLGDRTVVPEVVPMLGDADNQIVANTVYALENLTGQRLGPDIKAWRKFAGLDPSDKKAPIVPQAQPPGAIPVPKQDNRP